eukprot:716406-Pleurochrysis_carterae.AAC.1
MSPPGSYRVHLRHDKSSPPPLSAPPASRPHSSTSSGTYKRSPRLKSVGLPRLLAQPQHARFKPLFV